MVTATSNKVKWYTKGEKIYLPVPREFDFSHCLRFLDRSHLECLHSVQDQRWRKLLKIGSSKVLIEVQMSSGNLSIHPLNAQLTSEDQITLISYVWELFDLTRDLRPFYQHMRRDPVLEVLIKTFYGLRLIGIPELFEALSWSIIGQQINLTFAYKLKQRLVQAMGEKLHFEGQDYFLFPLPEKIAEMSAGDFSGWQFSNSKARYLVGVAKAIHEVRITKDVLLEMSNEEALAALLQLNGIGPWSAHYVMMKCLRMNEAYPVEDVGLHNAIKACLGNPVKPSGVELDAFGRRWHPWQAYATFYLWHSLLK